MSSTERARLFREAAQKEGKRIDATIGPEATEALGVLIDSGKFGKTIRVILEAVLLDVANRIRKKTGEKK